MTLQSLVELQSPIIKGNITLNVVYTSVSITYTNVIVVMKIKIVYVQIIPENILQTKIKNI